MCGGRCTAGATADQVAASCFEQARCREGAEVYVPGDLLLAGVVLHDVLPGRVGLGRGPALGGGVAVALAGVAPQPVTQYPVPHQLGAVEPEDVQMAARPVRLQQPVTVPPGLANHQPEP